MLLGMTNLFESEDARFAALMLRLCYVQGDASLRDHQRRILLDRLAPHVADVIGEGVADGSFHVRHPLEVAKLLLLLALDADEEACTLLARQADNPDALIDMLELLNAWREAAEELAGAPFGSLKLFDAARLVGSWQASAALLKE